MIRSLFARHPLPCYVVLFIAAMLVVRFIIAPGIVVGFGLTGFIVALAAIFLVGIIMERRGY